MSASVFAQNAGAPADTFAALVVSAIGADGLSFFTVFVSGDNIPADGWAEIETVGAIQDGSSGILVTVQNAGTAGILIDDLSVCEEDSTLATFDANLLG